MNKAAAENYLKTKVFTATPEQLQMMLYDGAIRFSEQGLAGLEASNFEQSFRGISSAQKIVLELTSSLRHSVAPEMCKNLAGLYAFIYRRMTDANSQREVGPLKEAIAVLKYQRETWALLMGKIGKEKAQAAASKMDVPAPDDRMEASISMHG